MKLLRIDSDKGIDKECVRMEIRMTNGVKLTITEYHGEIKIHSHSDEILVKPACANEIIVIAPKYI